MELSRGEVELSRWELELSRGEVELSRGEVELDFMEVVRLEISEEAKELISSLDLEVDLVNSDWMMPMVRSWRGL